MSKVQIKDIGNVITGKTPTTNNIENFDGDILFVTPADIAKGYIVEKTERTISNKGFNSIATNTISGESILVGCIGSDMGNVAITNTKCATNQQINSITNIKNEYNPFYIYYNLSIRKTYLRQIAGTTTTPILPKSVFEKIIIDCPDKDTQNKISKMCKSLDDKIRLNNKINEELENIAKTLYDYWFVQFDFPDENGHPYKSSGGKMIYNESLKREIPISCKVNHMKDFLDVVTGKEDANFSLKNGQYAFFTCGDEILKCPKPAFTGKAVLIAGNGNFNVKYFDGEFNAYQRTYVLIPNNEYYVGIIYQSALNILSSFAKKSNGSIIKFITKGDIEDIPIIIPKDITILNVFNKILNKQNHIKSENQKLTELKNFLLPMLMNGQVTVIDSQIS